MHTRGMPSKSSHTKIMPGFPVRGEKRNDLFQMPNKNDQQETMYVDETLGLKKEEICIIKTGKNMGRGKEREKEENKG